MSFDPRVPLPNGGAPSLPATIQHYLPELWDVRVAFTESLNGGTVDAETKEMLRLMNAAITDCAYCKNVRYGNDNGEQVVAEDDVSKVRDFENSDLPERIKVALRFARAFATDPAGISDDVTAGLRQHYTDEQIVEIGLALVRARAGSQALITLGLEPREMPVTII